GLGHRAGLHADRAGDPVLRRAEHARPGRGGQLRLARVREHQGPAAGAGALRGHLRGRNPMSHFVHPNALCESEHVGAGTRVWAFAHVLPGARVGRDCNICDGVFIEGGAVVGDRCTIKCGVQLWDGVRLGDDVFVGPNATFSNDRFPRSRRGARSGAGAVITGPVPPNAIVVGNPARIVGYVTDGDGAPATAGDADAPAAPDTLPAAAGGARLQRLPRFADLRGSLSAGEFERDLPFPPRRYFLVFDVPSRETRGEHAHRACHQFLVCVRGSVRVLADDGRQRGEFLLDAPDLGLYLPPMTWGTQFQYSPDAVLLVFASHPYDPDDYIRDYGEF